MVAAGGQLRYLLDTNVLSEPLRPRPDPALLDGFRNHRYELATCSPVWHELLYGARRLPDSRRRQAIEDYLWRVVLATVPILPYDAAAAEWHATERARLTAAGTTAAFVDGQIAAIAKAHDLVLVARNVADFQPFAGLRIENWGA